MSSARDKAYWDQKKDEIRKLKAEGKIGRFTFDRLWQEIVEEKNKDYLAKLRSEANTGIALSKGEAGATFEERKWVPVNKEYWAEYEKQARLGGPLKWKERQEYMRRWRQKHG